MSDDVKANIAQVINTVHGHLGSSFPREKLHLYIEQRRNKPLYIERDTMPAGMSGYTLGLRDVDLICIAEDADDIHEQITCLHEMGHILAGHIPIFSLGENTPYLTEFIFNRHQYHKSFIHKITGIYDTPLEFEAEFIGRFLLTCIYRSEKDFPFGSIGLYQ